MWRVLRTVIGSKKNTSEITGITADALNNYYTSVAPNLAATIPRPAAHVPVRLPRVNTGGLRVQPISMETLWNIILSMKPSSFVGADGISAKMMRDFFPGIGHILLDVVNASLETGRVPSSWKHAIIKPIPKGKHTSSDPSHTRPISLLPAITKITERAVQQQLVEYMESHHLLNDAQHGYRRLHSCETALHMVTDDVLRAMDNSEITLWVMVDLSKCFDMVPHDKLLEKLSLCGIDPFWLDNYLDGHTQWVQITSSSRGAISRSAVRKNSIGVYQGGSMSCILWSIYANDLCLHVHDSVRMIQFADDTQIWTTGKKRDLPILVDRIESALKSMFDWFCQNGMKVNAAKTEFMILGTKAMLRDVSDVTIKFCNHSILASKQARNLGVVFDQNLSFQPHVDHIVRKCTGMLTALAHARHVIPASTVRYLIDALVFSTIRYCLSVYGICGRTQVHRLQKLINFAARVLTGRRKFDHVSDVIRDAGWFSAAHLVLYHRLMVVYRLIAHEVPVTLAQTIGQPANQHHQHDTRGAALLALPNIRTEAGRNRLCFGAVEKCNEILRTRGNFNRTAIKTHLRSMNEARE